MTHMNLSIEQKQTHRHREQTHGCQEGREEEGQAGRWAQQMHTMIRWMDKPRGPGYSTANCIQYSVTNHNGKRICKRM